MKLRHKHHSTKPRTLLRFRKKQLQLWTELTRCWYKAYSQHAHALFPFQCHGRTLPRTETFAASGALTQHSEWASRHETRKNSIAVLIAKANNLNYIIPKVYRIITSVLCLGKLYERVFLVRLTPYQLLHSYSTAPGREEILRRS